MVTWPADPIVRLSSVCTVEEDGARVTHLNLGSHTGTHIESAAHFLRDGDGVDQIPLDRLIGPCRILDLRGVSPTIEREHLEAFRPRSGERILLRTDNGSALGDPRFRDTFVSLSPQAGRFLADIPVALVGIDYLSIESLSTEGSYPVHLALLERNIVIVEGLDLANVAPGHYDLIALPLRLEGLDASPARVLVRQRKTVNRRAGRKPA